MNNPSAPLLPPLLQPKKSNKKIIIIIVIVTFLIIIIIVLIVYFITKKKSNSLEIINTSSTIKQLQTSESTRNTYQPILTTQQNNIQTTQANNNQTTQQNNIQTTQANNNQTNQQNNIQTTQANNNQTTQQNNNQTTQVNNNQTNQQNNIQTTTVNNIQTTQSDNLISFNTSITTQVPIITTQAPIITTKAPIITTQTPIITTSPNLNFTNINQKILIVKFNNIYYTYIIKNNGLYVCQNTSCNKLSSLIFKHLFKVTTRIYGITTDNSLYSWEGMSQPTLLNNDKWEYGDGKTIQTFPNEGPDKSTPGWWGKKTNQLMYINKLSELNNTGNVFGTDTDWKVIRSVYNSFIGIKNDGSVYAWGYVHYHWDNQWRDYVELPTKINFNNTKTDIKFKDIVIGTSGAPYAHPTKIGNAFVDTTKVIVYDLIVYLIAENNNVYDALSSNDYLQTRSDESDSRNIINSFPLDTKYIKMKIVTLGYTSILKPSLFYYVSDHLSVIYGLTPDGILYYWILSDLGKTKINNRGQIIVDFDVCDSNTNVDIKTNENIIVYQDSNDKYYLKINDNIPQELIFN